MTTDGESNSLIIENVLVADMRGTLKNTGSGYRPTFLYNTGIRET